MEVSPNASASPRPRVGADREPKRVACIRCRQSKLRCDSPKNPCSRCERLKVPCVMDPQYRRVHKKSKIEELEKQVAHLRDTVQQRQQVPSVSFAPSPTPQYFGQVLQSAQNKTITEPVPSPTSTSVDTLRSFDIARPPAPLPDVGTKQYQRPPAQVIQAIESTALSLQEIDSAFNLFFEFYHPFLPLVSPEQSPDKVYEGSPLLFWIIVSVASRRHNQRGLLGILSAPVTSLLWSTISKPPLSLAAIQALCLLCMWPFPEFHIHSDTSSAISCIAMNSAIHMGLHRPSHTHEYVNFKNFDKLPSLPGDKIKTWAACNIVAQDVTGNLGLPPLQYSFDWSIDRACETGNPFTIPSNMRHHLILQRFCYKVGKIMSGDNSNDFGLPPDSERLLMMNALESDLNKIEGQIGKNLSSIDVMHLSGARIFLRVFHFCDSTQAEHRRDGILKAYNSAIEFIRISSPNGSFSSLLPYSTIPFMKTLLTAGSIVLEVLTSSYNKFTDYSAGVASFDSAMIALRQCSVKENDLPIRATDVLSYLWRTQKDDQERLKQIPTLSIKSRLGASLVFSSLWRWRELHLKARNATEADVAPINSGEQYENHQAMTWALFDDLDFMWNFDENFASQEAIL